MQDESGSPNVSPGKVPWTGSEILLGVFLAWVFWPALVEAMLQGIGFYPWFYGPEMVAVADFTDSPPVEKQKMRTRMTLWPIALASPLRILTFPLLFAALSGTRPEQMGLTGRRFGRNLLAGVVGMLVLTPIVFGIYRFVEYLSTRSGQGVEQHALEIVARQALFPSEWVLLVFAAMVAAPVLEELVFRGVLQPWLAMRRWRGHLAMLVAFALAVWFRREPLNAAWGEGLEPLLTAATPALFVLALLPIYLLVWWRSQTPLATALFGTSVLFACIHASVWPTPVPLFVLALGLGTLAYRTRSLVGPIVLHSLFNGVSCVQLWMEKTSRF